MTMLIALPSTVRFSPFSDIFRVSVSETDEEIPPLLRLSLLPPSAKRASRACWTWASLFASSADVASSKRRTSGLLKSARASATLCFCPPERATPLSPTRVSNPSGRSRMNSMQAARSAASRSPRS
mmetsp:Transcript_21460/g.42603  ORF Transcript_21460/g.42603 Transcript_21460/m.42603 type:complete len:126 (-) Transcript_21460:2092-2469(-)